MGMQVALDNCALTKSIVFCYVLQFNLCIIWFVFLIQIQNQFTFSVMFLQYYTFCLHLLALELVTLSYSFVMLFIARLIDDSSDKAVRYAT